MASGEEVQLLLNGPIVLWVDGHLEDTHGVGGEEERSS
jgi:hypothetical protein